MNAEERKVFLETIALMNKFGAGQLVIQILPDPWHDGEGNLLIKIDCGDKHVEFVTCGYNFAYNMQRLTKNDAVDYMLR